MKNYLLSIILSGILVLLFSMVMLYTAIFFFPTLMEEYYNAVFRSSSFETDWLFYAHPFVLILPYGGSGNTTKIYLPGVL